MKQVTFWKIAILEGAAHFSLIWKLLLVNASWWTSLYIKKNCIRAHRTKSCRPSGQMPQIWALQLRLRMCGALSPLSPTVSGLQNDKCTFTFLDTFHLNFSRRETGFERWNLTPFLLVNICDDVNKLFRWRLKVVWNTLPFQHVNICRRFEWW